MCGLCVFNLKVLTKIIKELYLGGKYSCPKKRCNLREKVNLPDWLYNWVPHEWDVYKKHSIRIKVYVHTNKSLSLNLDDGSGREKGLYRTEGVKSSESKHIREDTLIWLKEGEGWYEARKWSRGIPQWFLP